MSAYTLNLTEHFKIPEWILKSFVRDSLLTFEAWAIKQDKNGILPGCRQVLQLRYSFKQERTGRVNEAYYLRTL